MSWGRRPPPGPGRKGLSSNLTSPNSWQDLPAFILAHYKTIQEVKDAFNVSKGGIDVRRYLCEPVHEAAC